MNHLVRPFAAARLHRVVELTHLFYFNYLGSLSHAIQSRGSGGPTAYTLY